MSSLSSGPHKVLVNYLSMAMGGINKIFFPKLKNGAKISSAGDRKFRKQPYFWSFSGIDFQKRVRVNKQVFQGSRLGKIEKKSTSADPLSLKL